MSLYNEFPNLDVKYLEEIEANASDILNDPAYQEDRKYMQHGNVSIYEHTITVACYALEMADKRHLDIDRRVLIRACLLHDHFGYDWHTDKDKSGGKRHSYRHPAIAAERAKEDFDIDEKTESAIRSHMWPLGDHGPKSKEAWLLFWADKKSAFKESFREGKLNW